MKTSPQIKDIIVLRMKLSDTASYSRPSLIVPAKAEPIYRDVCPFIYEACLWLPWIRNGAEQCA